MPSPKKKQKRRAEEPANLYRKLISLWKKGESESCEVRGSVIHGRGVYATRFIAKDERVIEYVGELIDKKESDRRGRAQHARAVKTGDAAVYIFTISRNYDLDGNVPWNIARLINHSCAPNCEAQITGRRIYIHAIRDIHPGEELTFDYGFDVDCHEEHPCRCGAEECVGFIVARDQWPELRKRLKAAEAKTRGKVLAMENSRKAVEMSKAG
jgi:SET domain-containing protein